MTSSDPPEGPEHHTGTLSPVSPKPVHFPSPASFPILENQMDPSFNDHSLQDADSLPVTRAPATEGSSSASEPTVVYNVSAPAGVPADGSEQEEDDWHFGQDAASPVAQGQDGRSPAHIDAPALQTAFAVDSSMSVPQSAIDHGPLASQAQRSLSAPGLDKSIANANAFSGVNIQQLLDTIHASTAAAAASSGEGVNVDATSAIPQAPSSRAPQDMPQLDANLLALLSPAPAADAGDAAAQQSDPDAAGLSLHTNGSQAEQGTAFAVEQDSVQSPDISSAHVSTTPQPPLPTAGAPGTSERPTDSLPPPPLASFQKDQEVETTTNDTAQPSANNGGHQPHNIDAKDGENVPWDKDTQRKYDQFLDEERQYVLEGNWDRFPIGSRLFIGNLSSEKVTKRDLFHVFHRYGKLAQISIKQAYGFVQFLEAGDCARSLQREQGVSIRGRKVHLEISKPQKNKNAGNNNSNNEGRASRNRRSRTPERSGRSERHRGGRGRQDNYRPQRSPSPRARGGTESYRSRRTPDRFDGRRRSRSPKRSPASGTFSEDGLPMPRRAPHQVPELQILIKELGDRDRSFIDYIKSSFVQRGIKLEELSLFRLDETAVMRRQIIEGVLAVIRLDPDAQRRQRFHLSIFDRSAGNSSVRFEEYTDMELRICVELVIRAKQSAPPRPPADYAMAQYGIPSANPSPAVPQSPAGFALQQQQLQNSTPSNALNSMDPAALQRLLQGMQNPQGSAMQPAMPVTMQGHPVSSRLPMGNGQSGQHMSGVQYGQPQSPSANAGFNQYPKPPVSPYGMQFGAGPNGGLNGGAPPTPSQGGFQAPTGGAPANGADIQSIIAQLGQYRQ